MTPDEFRAWRRRMGLSRAALLDALHRLGWADLTMEGVNHWAKRGPSRCAAVVFGFMDRHPGDWNVQRTAEIASLSVETEQTHGGVTGAPDASA